MRYVVILKRLQQQDSPNFSHIATLGLLLLENNSASDVSRKNTVYDVLIALKISIIVCSYVWYGDA